MLKKKYFVQIQRKHENLFDNFSVCHLNFMYSLEYHDILDQDHNFYLIFGTQK